MSDAPTVDEDALAAVLDAELGVDLLETAVIEDGLNLSVRLATAEEPTAFVLRRPRMLRESALFADLETEFGLLEHLERTPVPAPAPILYCEDESVVGGPFLVMEYLEGETIAMHEPLPERCRSAGARRSLAESMVDRLAQVHGVDVAPIQGDLAHQSPVEGLDRAMDRLDRAAAATDLECPRLRWVADWLREHAPASSPRRLMHGDYKPGNLLVGPEPTVAGILDWEAAALGDPRTELGYFLLYWRDADDPGVAPGDLADRYTDHSDTVEDVRGIDERGFYPWTTAHGSPPRDALVDRWEGATGLTVERPFYHVAHAAVMLATVWADLHRHHRERGLDSTYEPLIEYASRVAAGFADGERTV